MTRPIPRKVHGAIDWAYVGAVAAAPQAGGFADHPGAVRAAAAVSGGVAATALLTRYEWGAVAVLSYRTHLGLDVAGGLFAMAAPWVFGFGRHRPARDFFLTAGAFSVAAGLLLSEPEEMP
jgi:hypothetical protein